MAGAGYKLFNTGDVLTASDVNTFLQEQVVMVFADSAARTSALSAVVAEGMVTYLQDTNSVEVFNGTAFVAVGGSSPLTTKGDLYTFSTVDARLGVGANGTTLVADSSEATGLKWATPAGGGGMTLINAGGTALTGATSITVGSIPATFNDLFVVIRNAKPTSNTGTDINVRINADSTANRHAQTFGYGLQRGLTFNGTFWFIMDQVSTSNAFGLCTISIPDYANTVTFKTATTTNISTRFLNDGTITSQLSYGIYNQTVAVSSLEFTCGNNFDGGTVFVYGVK